MTAVDSEETNVSDLTPLGDLQQRLVDAEAKLRVEVQNHRYATLERARLAGKAEGVALARDYLRHTMALVERA